MKNRTMAKSAAQSRPISALRRTLLNLLVLLTGASLLFLYTQVQAQTYKWVDTNGKVVYSDTPPPSNAKKLATKTGASAPAVSNVKLPAELAAAVAKNPVIFYSTSSCDACDLARAMLKREGVPFAENTVKTSADITKLNEVTGDSQLPVMTISRSKFRGFNEDTWREALSAAGYPETNLLPKEYRHPDPQPIVPVPAVTQKETKEKPPEAVKPRTTSPTGIRF